MQKNSLLLLESVTCHLFFGGFSSLTLLKHISLWVGARGELVIKGLQLLIIAASWKFFKKTEVKNKPQISYFCRVLYGTTSAFAVISSYYSLIYNEISVYVVGELLLIPLMQTVAVCFGLETRKNKRWYGSLILLLGAFLTFFYTKITKAGAYAFLSELSFLSSQQMGIYLAKMDAEIGSDSDSDFDALTFHANSAPVQALILFIMSIFTSNSFPININQAWENLPTEFFKFLNLFSNLRSVNFHHLIKWTMYIVPFAHIAMSFLLHTKFYFEKYFDRVSQAYDWSINTLAKSTHYQNILLLFQVFLTSRLIIIFAWFGICPLQTECLVKLSILQIWGLILAIFGTFLFSSGFDDENHENEFDLDSMDNLKTPLIMV